MATVNLTRLKKRTDKKTISVHASNLVPVAEGLVGLDINQLANLPPDAAIRDAYLVVNTATQAGVTAELGFAGGSELGTALPCDVAGHVPGLVVDNTDKVLTLTGKVLTVIFSATPTAGDIDVVVVYDEYTLCNGNLTQYI